MTSFTCLLLSAGLRVAVVERGPLAGRAQEWNVSKKELEELVGAFSTRFSRVAIHCMDCTDRERTIAKERWLRCCCGVTCQPWF